MTLHHVPVTLSKAVVFSLAGPVPMVTMSVVLVVCVVFPVVFAIVSVVGNVGSVVVVLVVAFLIVGLIPTSTSAPL